MEKAMVSLGKYLLVVQVLALLIGISRITALQSCSSSTIIELKASITPSRYLTSPNYPSNYPPSQNCRWKITAPLGHVIILTFLDLYIGGSISLRNNGCSDWRSDRLDIYDGHNTNGKLLGRYCSTYLPPKVFSSGTSLFLEFISDDYTERRGFKLEYSATVPKPDITICSPFNSFSQNNNIQLSGSSGYIESPLYGSKYPSNMQCTWVITVPEGKKIKLTFSDFVVGGSLYSCSAYHYSTYDNIQIKDGRYSNSNSLKTLCGHTLPSAVSSSGRYMWIRFKSNSNNYNTRSSTGFKAKYETLSDSNVGLVVGIVIAVCILIFLVCICVCIAHRKRTPGHVTVQAPAVTQTTTVQGTQNPACTTLQYPQQMQGGFVPPPPVGYSSAGSYNPPPSSGYPPPTQGSYQHPPPGSYPMSSTGGGTSAPGYPPQSSVPMMPYPQHPIPNDPPPAYPGPPAYPPQGATGQPAPSNPNPPYPPPQGAETQQSSPPYPPAQDTKQATAPPPF